MGSGFRGSEVQGSRFTVQGSEVQRFRGSEVQRFRGSGFRVHGSGFRGSEVQGYKR